MATKDKRIDAYIAKSQDFAKPILKHIRELVHKACPDVEETIKWGFPHFQYKGEMMCGVASFKQHCSFGFWKAAAMEEYGKGINKTSTDGMGNFGKITSLKDLPSDKLMVKYIKEAMRLNDEGIKNPARSKPKAGAKELVVPDYFTKAISKNKRAKTTFDNFSTSNRREYVDWVTEAKTEETRNTRLQTAIEWMAEGKIRNWKYLKK